jgi:hypothetical protein
LSAPAQVFLFTVAEHPFVPGFYQCVSQALAYRDDPNEHKYQLANSVLNALIAYIIPLISIIVCYACELEVTIIVYGLQQSLYNCSVG